MPFETMTIVRLCGIAGIVGALVTGVGDLLYNHIPGSTQTIYEKMSSLTQRRLVTAGILGLIGSWLYFFSAFHIYYAFLSVGENFALLVALSFAMVGIAYGVGHASYYAIGSTAKLAREYQLDVNSAGKIGEALFSKLVLIIYVPVAVLSLFMIYGVVSGRSAYPIWMVLFLPIVPYLLRTPLLKSCGAERVNLSVIRTTISFCYCSFLCPLLCCGVGKGRICRRGLGIMQPYFSQLFEFSSQHDAYHHILSEN